MRSKIRVTNIDPAGSPPALITGQVPAIAGYAQGYVPSVEIRGNKKARILWYADCGVTAVSNGIIVHADLIKEDPELIRSFVAASLKGFLYGRAHVDEMAAIVKKFSEATVPAISRREAELSFNTWVTPNTAGKPLGWMSDQDWQETVTVLKQYGGVTSPLEAVAALHQRVRPDRQRIRSAANRVRQLNRMMTAACDCVKLEQDYLRLQGLSKVYATHDGPVRALDRVSLRRGGRISLRASDQAAAARARCS